MKRGKHGQPSVEDQEPEQFDKTSFAVGFAVSSTQHFLSDFSSSIQVSPNTLARGVAKFLQTTGSERPLYRMSGLFRETTEARQGMEPLALAVGASGDQQPLNGNGKHHHMSAEGRARIAKGMRKRWRAARKSGRNALVPVRLTGKGKGKNKMVKAHPKKKSQPRPNISGLIREVVRAQPYELTNELVVQAVRARGIISVPKKIVDIISYMRRSGQLVRDDKHTYAVSEKVAAAVA